jgi:hypothetical protein
VDRVGLHVGTGRPVVPDLWSSKDDYLTGVRRIGDNLLIPRHRGIEYNLTDGYTVGTDDVPAEHRTVG